MTEPTPSRSESPFRDPFVVGAWWTFLVLAVLVAAVFGLLLLGDGLGLWAFDSGLGCENGDVGCQVSR